MTGPSTSPEGGAVLGEEMQSAGYAGLKRFFHETGGSYTWDQVVEAVIAAVAPILVAQARADGAAEERERADGIGLIAAERQRQVVVEQRTADHDANHYRGEMARAAAMYALPPEYRYTDVLGAMWPRDWQFKPAEDRVRELVKAGALIAAEIDRIARGAS